MAPDEGSNPRDTLQGGGNSPQLRVTKLEQWIKILRELTAPQISPHLEDRIYKQILIDGQNFSKAKETEFQDGIELMGKLMLAQMDYTRLKGNFGDMFGDFLIEEEKLNTRAGQFFTPMQICDLMTGITLQKETMVGEPQIFLDPAAGSGRFMLATAKCYAEATGQLNFLYFNVDIDFTVYVYCTMNAILHKIPSFNIWGNSLSDEYREAIGVIPGEFGLPTTWHSISKEKITEIMHQHTMSTHNAQKVTAAAEEKKVDVATAPVISSKKRIQATLF